MQVVREAKAALLQPRPVAPSVPVLPETARKVPQATFSPGEFSDATELLIPLAGAVNSLAVQRPRTTRVLLIISNPTALPLFFAFGQGATLNSNFIPAGGSLFMDRAVPQNDVYLFSTPGGNIPVTFTNSDVSHAVVQ